MIKEKKGNFVFLVLEFGLSFLTLLISWKFGFALIYEESKENSEKDNGGDSMNLVYQEPAL